MANTVAVLPVSSHLASLKAKCLSRPSILIGQVNYLLVNISEAPTLPDYHTLSVMQHTASYFMDAMRDEPLRWHGFILSIYFFTNSDWPKLYRALIRQNHSLGPLLHEPQFRGDPILDRFQFSICPFDPNLPYHKLKFNSLTNQMHRNNLPFGTNDKQLL